MNGQLLLLEAMWDVVSTFIGVFLALVTFTILEDIWNRKD